MNAIITPTKVCTLYTQCKLKFLTALLKISSFFGKRNISHKWHFTFSLDIIILTTAAAATDVRNTKLDFNFEHFHRS